MIIQKNRHHRRPVWLPILVMLVAGIGFYIWQLHQQVKIINSLGLVTPIALASFEVEPTKPPPIPVDEELSRIDDSNLKKIVADSLTGTSGTYAVAIKNLKTGEHFELNGDHVFESGSLYKLWVMGAIYEQEKAGSLDDSDELTESVQSLNQKFGLSSEVAELTDGVIDYSTHDALEKMITISDNYTALLLTSKIKLSTVANFLKEHGFNSSTVGTNSDFPMTTALDMESFFEKLYQGNLADPQYTQKMLDLLKQQRLNDKIPKDLPDNVVIAHKTGELDTFTHDAGIVYLQSKEASPHTPTGDYIIVVMSDSEDPPAAEGRISDISQAVYGYFTKGR